MRSRRLPVFLALVLPALAAYAGGVRALAQSADDPVVRKIIQLGTTDNQVMKWNDYASNRFGGRETGTDAYTNATQWAVWQFKQFGVDAELDEVGEVPVGFNRGPWFGRMTKPTAKELRFGTPTYTAGTKGVQRGGVVILKADPYTAPRSTPGTNQEEILKNRQAAVTAAIAEINGNKAAFKGKWVLIGGASNGFARDGRRASSTEAKLLPPLTDALVGAGALGTIQSAAPTATPSPTMAGQSQAAINILDGYAESWDKLPVLPDIKLLKEQYDEIKGMAEKSQPVELEFDVRNWFKMGPVKYHNVVATLRGSQYPDEYIVMGGHFDCFSGATGGIDNGSGFATSMEAMRLIRAAGGQPKRSIVMILFAAEENGLVGSQSWLKKHPELQSKIVLMINRDHTPGAVTGASVPAGWYADVDKIAAPLASLNPKWPFKLTKTELPNAPPERPSGTDSSSFSMLRIPTLRLSEQTDYAYNYAWHTLNDLYSELVPYTEHQQHTALATAVLAYGAANLEKPLTRRGVYLDDGLYATILTSSGRQMIASLDYVNAPLHTANFIRIVEGNAPAGAGARGRAPQGPAPAAAGGGRGRGDAAPPAPPIGKFVKVTRDAVNAVIASDIQKKFAVKTLPKQLNAAVKHDAAGVLGIAGPDAFYLTLKASPGLDRKYTALGKVIAGGDGVATLKKDDAVVSIRITRVGQAARDFKTDDESFGKLLEAATAKKKTTRP